MVDVSKIKKIVQYTIPFVFEVLSDNVVTFFRMWLILKKYQFQKNLLFLKTRLVAFA